MFLISRYVYVYQGKIADLKIEAGKALGFEIFSVDELLNLSESDKAKFIPYILEVSTTKIIEFIKHHEQN